MQNTAIFSFKNDLNIFLPAGAVADHYPYHFTDTPSIKDAVEAIGIPHTEADVIVVNGRPVSFNYLLHNGDRADVYTWQSPLSAQHSLTGRPPADSGFIVDAHLGTLARTMRLLGFDTLYDAQLTETDIVKTAVRHQRIILTRSINLLKHKALKWGYWPRSQDAELQAQEVVQRYNLAAFIQPFRRCVVCNGLLLQVPKNDILHLLPPKTKQFFNDFWQCNHCNRVYWKGSHYEKMELLAEKIKLATG